MILQKLIDSLNKTDDSIKMINSLNKTADFIKICFLDMFHVFSLVCFLINGVKSRSGHDGSQSFGPIFYVSGPKIGF